MIGALVGDVHTDDDLAGGVRAELHIEGGTSAAVGHLHLASIGVGRRTASGIFQRIAPPFFLGRLHLSTGFQSVADMLLTFASRAFPCRLLATTGRGRIFQNFLFERRDLLLSLDQAFFQRRLAAERRRAGTGPHPHAVLSHALKRHGPDAHQLRDLLREQPVQHRAVIHAKIRQRVIVHRHVPTDPLKPQMQLALPIQFACAADALDRRVQPQAEQNLGIRRGSSRLAFHRENAVVQFGQVALLDKRDDGACLIVGRQHLVECQHPHHNLIATGDSQPRRPPQRLARPRLAARRIRSRRILKQPPLHHDSASAPP